MEFKELFCTNCKKVVGRYNIKFYDEVKIAEVLNTTHSEHIKNGHYIVIRKFVKD